MNFPTLLKNPFRFFFSLGWIAGVLGVDLWLPLTFGDIDFYPVQTHRLIMVGGFLLAFVVGFPTIAIPHFPRACIFVAGNGFFCAQAG